MIGHSLFEFVDGNERVKFKQVHFLLLGLHQKPQEYVVCIEVKVRTLFLRCALVVIIHADGVRLHIRSIAKLEQVALLLDQGDVSPVVYHMKLLEFRVVGVDLFYEYCP